MASLPSGSRNEVELVKIETDKLSLLIKGKPYHERYEGLKQYRKMNAQYEMQFFVNGEDVQEVHVFDVDFGQLCMYNYSMKPIFFENGIYQIIVIPKVDGEFSFYHEHPSFRQAISPVKLGKQTILMGSLQFRNEVGLTTFEIRKENHPILEITFEIFPVKLDYKKDYQKLLQEVNDEIYNLAFHFIQKTYLKAKAKLEGNPSRTEFFRLITYHFQQFMQALKRIEQQPHHQLQKNYEMARGDQLRRLDSTTRSFLRKRSYLFVEVQKGIMIDCKQLMPIKGLQIRKKLTNDTLENRFVKWMIERLIHKLTDLLLAIDNERKKRKQEPNQDLMHNIESMRTKLENKLNEPFWNQIGKLDRSVISLVLQMAPGYRDAYQIFLIVSKGLTLQSNIYRMSVKDVALLYEYWTFLKIGQILSRKYNMVSQDIIRVNRDGLYVNLQANKKAERVFRHPITNEEIILTYQKYEDSLPTIPQKPDSMLTIEKKGKGYKYNYIFDAKYRIDYALEGSSYCSRYHTPGPLEEDINTMHRYRDSIVAANDGPYERTAFGAYVLFPWFDEILYQNHHFYKSIDKVNIGGLPFLPNATQLVEQFVERLIDKSPEEIQKEGILPRGSLEEWHSSLDEKVLVGLVSTPEQFEDFLKEGYYLLQNSRLKKGWQEGKYIALYCKNGVGTEKGVYYYGMIEEVKIIDGDVRFEIDYWRKLPTIIKPVNYGISNFMITTLNLLEEAKELPELFLKSKEEMTLWRMLRRVSDDIKMDLDAINVDEAAKIKKYQIKDITVYLEKGIEHIIFQKNQMEIKIPIDTLHKNPSSVFRKLIEMM